MRIVINGAGIGGTTLAFWLLQADHEVILVERSPQLRSGGYLIDFWGGGYDVAERMGLIPRLTACNVPMREVRYVDSRGRKTGGFPVETLRRLTNGRFLDVRRSDLAGTIFSAIRGRLETRFGDSVAECMDLGSHVHVGFEHSTAVDVDMLVGADGLHSRVRDLVFGPEQNVELRLGYHVAAFEVSGYRPREDLMAINHAVPGRQVTRLSLGDDRTLFLFVFRDEYLLDGTPLNERDRRAALRRVFGDVGWECPRILGAMADASDIYFDRVSQIRMRRWTQGRTALVGDAAACVSLLAGEGTGLAMMEAYVLAGELAHFAEDHLAAFSQYEEIMRPFVERKQRSAQKFASSFTPKTALGIRVRDQVSRLLQVPFIANLVVGRVLRDDIALPDYSLDFARSAGAAVRTRAG